MSDKLKQNSLLNIVDANEIYTLLLKRLLRSTHASTVAIYFYHPENASVSLFSVRGDNCGLFSDEHKIAFEEKALETCQKAQSSLSQDISLVRELMAIPMSNGPEQVFACALFTDKVDGDFDEEDLGMAEVVVEAFVYYLNENEVDARVLKPRNIFLSTQSLNKFYGEGIGQVKALNDVSFNIGRGELIVILGSSGSGKSTLLNIIGGMTPPTSGKVEIGSIDLCQANEKMLTDFRRNTVGFVFQFYNLIGDLTARENVALSAGLSNNPMDVDEALALVGLADRAQAYPSQMSGGEQQRVSIARALVKRADFLLCDEPTGALDSKTGRQILRLLESICKEQEQTIVIVTHSTPIASMANRIIHMDSGRIIEEIVNLSPISADQIDY
ncbi:ABC transporter ATP-binding protein [Eubacteriaceae bacterium ES3]|nr:ABC transporter ATP-binding protein [Eubacteriaceae bacterium ES3]